MSYVIGIDGGGTKTECLIAGADGRRLGRGVAAGSSLTHRGSGDVRGAIAAAIAAAEAEARLIETDRRECLAVCAGFAGAGRTSTDAVLLAALGELLPEARKSVVVDFRVAFEGATQGGPGIIVIAGTGSIAYGRNVEGHDWRVGGWGPDVGDEGSGFRIGRDAVAALLEAHDGRRPPTELRGLVLHAWNAADEDEVIDKMRVDVTAGARPPFAMLLPAVVAAADHGDNAARRILDRAGSDLAALVTHVAHALDMREPLVAHAGGVFQHARRVRDQFATAVQLQLPRATVGPPRESPAEGAVRLALHLIETRGEAPASARL